MGPNLRVLVVDDEATIRETLGAALSKLGHTFELADSVEAAIEILDGDRFDLVITDFHLPEKNGEHLARIVKRQDGEMPVLLISGDPPDKTAGFDHLLRKPFDVDSLKAALFEVCSRRGTTFFGEEFKSAA